DAIARRPAGSSPWPARRSTRPSPPPGDTRNHDSGESPSPLSTRPPPPRLPPAPSTPASDPTILAQSPAPASPGTIPAERQNNPPTIPPAALPVRAPTPSRARPTLPRQNPARRVSPYPTAAPPSRT